MIVFATLTFLFFAGNSSAAYAEYVSPFPSYTHYTASGGLDTAVDPINVFFGGTWYDGIYGAANGVQQRISNDVAGWGLCTGTSQYVLFKSNLNNQVWRGMSYQLGTAPWAGPRYHVRIFQNPYATSSGSYAEKNCVGDIHHEDFDHDIDISWEAAEDLACYAWDCAVPNYIIEFDQISNTPAAYWPDGNGVYWWNNGLVTKCRLYP